VLTVGTCVRRSLHLAAALFVTLSACATPISQYRLRDQKLTCEQANQYAFRTLQGMGFTITEFEPATPAHAGKMRGTREELGTQKVTVRVTCTGTGADLDASEDGKWLGQIDFKRGFYLAFTANAAAAAISESIARDQANRPPDQRTDKGLQVLLKPVKGLGAKLDFDLDLAAAGVLPVQVMISNITSRTYTVDPADTALAQKDGTRVHPLNVEDAVQRVVGALRQKPSGGDAGPLDSAEVTRRLASRLFTAHAVSPNQTVQGYLYFPLGDYVKGRVTLEDQASEEDEGFVVEF
jgi:hypothetical protein